MIFGKNREERETKSCQDHPSPEQRKGTRQDELDMRNWRLVSWFLKTKTRVVKTFSFAKTILLTFPFLAAFVFLAVTSIHLHS